MTNPSVHQLVERASDSVTVAYQALWSALSRTSDPIEQYHIRDWISQLDAVDIWTGLFEEEDGLG